ncbi:HDIG domain-containing protein [Planosporangium thailandense]|uniref:HDIG domain-containing protein n=1 Tax=Planosporangium thailandense TaxID=765197 RepID=A0ABX0XXQ5_9ACTN|nr:HD domain-containing protein [Planosporangium thailandense]NJC70832.1 HDIG domain-containing protein [Planosporangium thailandense]
MQVAAAAERDARAKLAEALPRRWRHVQAVATKAQRVSSTLSAEDRPLLIAAAWLHDIGYAPGLATTGFHPLDGARWLRQQGFNERIMSLVAYHSCAIFEAKERGLADQLTAEFVDEESTLKDALWYADLTTGPDGQNFDVLERLAEIRERYGPDHLVTQFWTKAEPVAVAAVRRTEARLAATGQPM